MPRSKPREDLARQLVDAIRIVRQVSREWARMEQGPADHDARVVLNHAGDDLHHGVHVLKGQE